MSVQNLQVKGLAFNQLSPNLLASGGADGDIIIWDVANPRKPTAFPPLKASLTCHVYSLQCYHLCCSKLHDKLH